MDDPDIEMGGIEPATPSLPYGIPYPPELEPFQRMNDDIFELTDWATHATYHGARDHPNGNGFEVRLFNKGDPTGKGKWFPDDWDVQYRLGPPSTSVRWNSSSFMHPTGGFASKRNPTGMNDERIHPVFRREVWQNLTEPDYQTIMPALLLASAFLDEPSTLCLFHAISVPADQMTTIEDPNLKNCKRLQVPETLTEPEQWAVFHKISAMRQWTSFFWESSDKLKARGAFGFCRPLVHKDGSNITASGPHTRQSEIALSMYHLEVLRGLRSQTDSTYNYYRYKARKYFDKTLKSAGVLDSHRPPETCIDSVRLRTTFLFAALLVHELAHAFSFAYFERVDNSESREPWVADNRSNELGHAMIRFIIGGSPYSPSFHFTDSSVLDKNFLEDNAYAQFGVYFLDRRNQWATPGNERKEQHLKEGAQEDQDAPLIYWPVPQRQIYDYFTENLWLARVPAYGLEALKMVKLSDWGAYYYPGPDPKNPWRGATLK
ncbi:hypothetical protein KCU65_g1204, partial [Aureobasidium melanogenum]